MLLQILAPTFVAGIDFEDGTVAPTLKKWCAGKNLEEVLREVKKRGYKYNMIVTGQIEKIGIKETQWGKYYDVYVDGNKYGIGKKRPAFSDGDWVTFEAEQNDKGFYNADPTTFKKAETPKTTKVTSPAKETEAPKRAWVPDDKRQDSISYQAARNSALAFVEILVQAQKVDFGKLKHADSIAMLETYVDNYTKRFFEDTKNLGHKAEVSVSLGDPNDSLENI